MEETMMDKKTQKIGVICSIVQIILSIICLIYNAINQENIIIWVLFLCSGILLLSSNISRNNKKEDEWGSATSNLYGWHEKWSLRNRALPCLPIQIIGQFKVVTGSNH